MTIWAWMSKWSRIYKWTNTSRKIKHSKGYITWILSDTEYCRTLDGIVSYHKFTSLIWVHHIVSLLSHNCENDSLLIHENRSNWLFALRYMLSTFRNLFSPFWRISFCSNPFWKNVLRVYLFLSSNHLRALKGVYLFINSLFSGEGSPETDLCSNFT